MAVQIQLRHDTAAAWTSANPTLAQGEIGLETDTDRAKVGDGVTAWASLAYSFESGGGVGVTDGDKGDVTVSSTGTVWTIDSNVVTNSKLADMTTARIKGRSSSGTGDPEDLTGAQVKTMLALVKGDVGLGAVDNTSDATKNSATATLTNKSISLGSNTVTTTFDQLNTAVTDANLVKNVQGVTGIWMGSQAAYDALTPDSSTFYIITS